MTPVIDFADLARTVAALSQTLFPDTVDDLQRTIALRSDYPPHSEEAVADFIAQRLTQIGAHVRFQRWSPGRPNVIGSFRFGPEPDGGPSVLLTSHTDVVPADETLFEPKVDGGRLYGRGACDAKGPLIAMLAACDVLARLASDGQPLNGQLHLGAVVAEESGGHGTKLLAQEGPHFDYAILGEPSELAIITGHRGSFRRRVTFQGVSAHSSEPDKGVNALSHAARFVLGVEGWHRRLQARRHPLFGSPSVSPTVIQGGTGINVIPDRCHVLIDRRMIPGETLVQVEDELNGVLAEVRAAEPDAAWDIEDLAMDKPPGLIDETARVVRALERGASHVLGRSPEFGVYMAGTDMSLLLEARVETAILGPGSIREAHTDHEFVDLEQLRRAVDIYALAVCDLLAG